MSKYIPKNIIKKITIVLLCSTMFFSQTVFASEINNTNNTQKDFSYYEYRLDKYFDNYGFDFMGGYGEILYFELREEYSQGNPLRKIEFEAKTLKYQAKLTKKTYEDNDVIYDLAALGAGAKYFVFNRMPTDIFKRNKKIIDILKKI